MSPPFERRATHGPGHPAAPGDLAADASATFDGATDAAEADASATFDGAPDPAEANDSALFDGVPDPAAVDSATFDGAPDPAATDSATFDGAPDLGAGWAADETTAPTSTFAPRAPARATADPAEAPSPVALFAGRYHLRSVLGQGGMGVVWLADDTALERPVALKLLTDPLRSPARREAFLYEAKVTAQLEHPHIVPVHDAGLTDSGAPWLVMKRVEGRSLHEVMRAGPPPPALAPLSARMRVGRQVGAAVHYAHGRGVLHRDIKPQNIMLGRFDEVLLLDWGLALRVGAGVPGLAGSPGYVPPELLTGAAPSPRSDLWALGVVWAELALWQTMFTGPTAAARLRQPLAGPPPALLGAAHLGDLRALLLRMLSADPAARPSQIADVIDELDTILDGRQRVARADAWLARADEAAARAAQARAEAARAEAEAAALGQATLPWAPLDEKAPLLQAEAEAKRAQGAARRGEEDALAAAEAALAEAPEHPPARAALSGLLRTRLGRALSAGDAAAAEELERRVRALGVPADIAALDAPAEIDLGPLPPGCGVELRPVLEGHARWELGPPTTLRAPGAAGPHSVHVAPGAWHLRWFDEHGRSAVTTLRLGRGGRWTTRHPLPLIDVPEGWAYVPAGPVRLGGDPELRTQLPTEERDLPGFLIRRLQVTAAEYRLWLLQLASADPAAADQRRPRVSTGSSAPSYLWPPYDPTDPWPLPFVDGDGDHNLPNWPALGVDWFDAVAFAAAAGARLPTEPEWEKAGRGGDGRLFPWGDRFDASLCWMAASRPDKGSPKPVGASPDDESVYGVRDLAGGCREWCAEDHLDERRQERPVRGGSWIGSARLCRLANRFGYTPRMATVQVGLRLARELPT